MRSAAKVGDSATLPLASDFHLLRGTRSVLGSHQSFSLIDFYSHTRSSTAAMAPVNPFQWLLNLDISQLPNDTVMSGFDWIVGPGRYGPWLFVFWPLSRLTAIIDVTLVVTKWLQSL